MPVRVPMVAGQFYPGSPEACRAGVAGYLSQAGASVSEEDAPVGQPVGGIVPHAGWVFSGAVAAGVIQAVTADQAVETFVIFGAVHRLFSGPAGLTYGSGSWQTPLGDILIDEELAAGVIRASSAIVDNPRAHDAEHSIEVQVPFVQYLAPSARLLPVMVPPTRSAHQVGHVVAEQAQAIGRKVAILGSTDLTHYGPRYQFTPMGAGPKGLKWAKEVNDRRVLELMINLRDDEVVAEAEEHHNACGSGAVAAAIRACRTCGAQKAHLFRHTTSSEVARDRYGDMDDAVGYAGVVFSRPA